MHISAVLTSSLFPSPSQASAAPINSSGINLAGPGFGKCVLLLCVKMNAWRPRPNGHHLAETFSSALLWMKMCEFFLIKLH